MSKNKKQPVVSEANAKSLKGFPGLPLMLSLGILLFFLVIIGATGIWWLATADQKSNSNQVQALSEEASFPDASMPSCQDRPASGCLLSVNPFYQKLKTGYGQPLNQTQTLTNVTLRLDWVYADTNYILVAYSLIHPQGFNLYTGQKASTLSIENQPLPVSLGISMAGGNDNALALIETFDSSTLLQTEGELNLQFSIPGFTLEKIPPTPTLQPSHITPYQTPAQKFIAPELTSTPGPADTLAAQTEVAQKSAQTTAGPFSLKFKARLTPGQVLEPKQTVKAAAGTATLERIVITPMTERLFISGLKGEPDIRLIMLAGAATFTPDAVPESQTNCGQDPNGLVSCNLEPGTLKKKKDWQIVLRRGIDVPLPTTQPCPECAPPALVPTPQFSLAPLVPSGPWIFKLKL